MLLTCEAAERETARNEGLFFFFFFFFFFDFESIIEAQQSGWFSST